VPFHIGDERFANHGFELATLAGRLARQAAASTSRTVRVAGSLPPLFGSYRPDLFDPAVAPRIIDPLVEGLAAHADLWLGETLGSIAEARAVRASLDRAGVGDRPLWISYTLDDSRTATLASGESVSDAVAAAIDLGAGAVLFNCCAVETITAAIAIAAVEVDDRVEIGGYANRFVTTHTESGQANERISALRDDLDPQSYRTVVAEWLRLGAAIIGGCCGMEPAHIAALAELTDVGAGDGGR